MSLREHLAAALGEEICADDGDQYLVDGLRPDAVCYPRSLEELSRCLAGTPPAAAVIPVGYGKRLGFGGTPQRYDLAISSRRMNRVLAHEAADLTVTVEAGITLADLNAQLATTGQHLPLDPPHPETATIGAIIATDACGPLRYSRGKVRDLLIGVRVVLSDGTVVKGGGQVVKNVAGYDLMKLFTGSFGTLGVIAEASFKLRPLPEYSAVAMVPCSEPSQALEQGLQWRDAAIEPSFLQALDDGGARHCGLSQPCALVGLAGSRRELDSQLEELERLTGQVERLADAEAVYRSLCNFPCPQTRDEWVIRISALPSQLSEISTLLLSIAGKIELATMAEIGNSTLWLRLADSTEATQFAQLLRPLLRPHDAHVTFAAAPPASRATLSPWGDLPAAALQRRIKAAVDPLGRMSPGRLIE